MSNEPEKMITDFAGNTYPESALNEQETPNWDPHGAKKDRAMQSLGEVMQDAASKLPKVGDRAEVTGGRKHKGKTGVVFWRGADKFNRPSRYGSDLQRCMAQALGRYDRLGIQTDRGEKFFVRLPDAKKIAPSI